LKVRVFVLAAVLSVALAAPAQALKVSVPAPNGLDGWFVSYPTIQWIVDEDPTTVDHTVGCERFELVAQDTSPSGVTRTCTVYLTDSTSDTASVRLWIDTKPPSIAVPVAQRGPDSNGWYNHAVNASWSGSDGNSGIAGCDTKTYSGPDGANASISGGCQDVAGNRASRALPLSYDASPPQITGANPDRVPDFGNWFLNPVTLTFAGSDATSGVARCDQVAYSGPDGAQAGVTGGCTDKAGNVATTSVPIAYDANAPALTPKAASGDTVATLTWKTSSDTQSVVITRKPGPSKPVYQGDAAKFEDRHVRNGTRYTYTLTATDEAGHTTTASAKARPTAQLISPRPFARLKAPPLLRWKRVHKARYYNVQLYRVVRGAKGKTVRRKILSGWPVKPRLRLHSAWRYNGHWHRLAPGTYLWYVWPGYGQRSQRRFGRLRGVRTFTVI
jgi:hypothetical protein